MRSNEALLRYSGGKSKVQHLIMPHVYVEDRPDFTFFDVMVGGGSTTLSVARKYSRVSLHINDLDENMYAFWRVVAVEPDDSFTKFIRKLNVKPTIELFNFVLDKEPENVVDRAYRTIFLNRTCFSTSHGKRPLGGWGQENGGIATRWNYERTIRHLLEARRLLHGRTIVTGDDFAPVLRRAAAVDGFAFCDPPYYIPGNELYTSTEKWRHEDHERLRRHLTKVSRWLLCYDDHPEVRKLYTGKEIYTMPMKYSAGSKRKKVDELLIKSEEAICEETLTGASKTSPQLQP